VSERVSRRSALKYLGAAGAGLVLGPATFRARTADLTVRFTDGPPTIHVERASGEPVQRLTLDPVSPRVLFQLPQSPILGLGEGGPQFDRKGCTDAMRNGQGAYRPATHGTRAGAVADRHRRVGDVHSPAAWRARTTASASTHRRGEWMRVRVSWRDAGRRPSLGLAPGSRMLPPGTRAIRARVAGETRTTDLTFGGRPVSVTI
jgi:hypothetical protein